MCVYVYHLKRCKTASSLLLLHEVYLLASNPFDECMVTVLYHVTLSNEAVHQRMKHPLTMDVYLQVCVFRHKMRLTREPPSPLPFHTDFMFWHSVDVELLWRTSCNVFAV